MQLERHAEAHRLASSTFVLVAGQCTVTMTNRRSAVGRRSPVPKDGERENEQVWMDYVEGVFEARA